MSKAAVSVGAELENDVSQPPVPPFRLVPQAGLCSLLIAAPGGRREKGPLQPSLSFSH